MTRFIARVIAFILSGLVVLAPALADSKSLTIERIFQSPSLSGSSPKKPAVSPNGEWVTYLKGKATDQDQLDLWGYHVASKKHRLLVDSDGFAGSEALSDEEKARRERARMSGTGIVDYQWSKDSRAILFPVAGDAFYVQLIDGKVQRLLNTESFETDFKLSPLGNYLSFIREQNLFVKHIATGKEIAITQAGGGDIKYGMAEFVAQEEMKRFTGYWWSPDEQALAFTEVDETPVETITRTEIYADEIKLIQQKYPRAGSANATIRLAVQNIQTRERNWVELTEDWGEDIYLARVQWLPAADALSFQVQTRDQKRLALRRYILADKTTTTLLTEESKTWVNLHDDLKFINDSGDFIWASERSGFKHLYLHQANGELLNAITQGEWVVDKIAAFDKPNRRVYFAGRRDTPLESRVYSVSLDGGEVNNISRRSGFHEVTFSTNAAVYIDRFSTLNQPWQVSLHDANGEHLTWLEENRLDKNHPLTPYLKNWVEPELGSITNSNGDTLYYRFYKPKHVTGKRPVIVYTYGGPLAQVVRNRWAGARGLMYQYWLNQGYLVFSLDNRGSNYRGKAFEEPIFQAMGTVEVEDQIAGVNFLRSLDYVDPDRIGIYGHSYGGYLTLMAMFKAGDYFKAGVSGAPVTDWRLYDTHYTERYLGNPSMVAGVYDASSVFPYAKDLIGDLFIYHGMADDNVLFTNSTRLYKHLQDLTLPFEMMDYPGKKHGLRGEATNIHRYKTITRFFDRTLKP